MSYVHEAVVGDDEVEGAVVEGQVLGAAQDVAAGGVGLGGRAQQGGGGVEAGDAVAAGAQVAGHTALAAAHFERGGARVWHEGEERVAIAPVGVVAGRPRPGKPLLGTVLEAHAA
jgi:hypothetical protein